MIYFKYYKLNAMNKIPVLPVEVPEVVEGDSALPGPPDGRVEPEEEHLGEERGQLLRRRVSTLSCWERKKDVKGFIIVTFLDPDPVRVQLQRRLQSL